MFIYHALIHCVNSQNLLIVEMWEACKPWWQQSGGKRAGFYRADMAESSFRIARPCTQLPPLTKSLTETNDATLSSPHCFPSNPPKKPHHCTFLGIHFPITLQLHTSNII